MKNRDYRKMFGNVPKVETETLVDFTTLSLIIVLKQNCVSDNQQLASVLQSAE